MSKMMLLVLLVVSIHSLVSSFSAFRVNSMSSTAALDVLQDHFLSSFDFVRSAYVPSDVNTAIAVGLSEAIAGAIGGLLSRGTARAVRDQKKDSLGTKVASTSVFFGVRGLTRTIFGLLGMPRPVYYIVSAMISACLSEAAKAFGRDSDNNIKRLRSEIEVQLNLPEVAGDLVKWLTYDGLFQYAHKTTSMLDQALLSFSYGAGAAVLGLIISYSVTRATDPNPVSNSTRPDYDIAQVSKIALEGGVMFVTFQTILSLLATIVPKELNFKFAFNTFLESVEGDMTSNALL